jgi:hypothetical protein
MTRIKYSVEWKYASGLEAPRVSILEAEDKKDAIAQVRRKHIDIGSQLRNDIQVIDVRSVGKAG